MTSWRADSSTSAHGAGGARRNDPERDVAITAGGIGGLTLASSLAQRPVSVFEQDNELRQIGVGAGTACANARVLPGTAGFVLGPQQARAAWFSGAAGVAIAGAPQLIAATVSAVAHMSLNREPAKQALRARNEKQNVAASARQSQPDRLGAPRPSP